MRLLPLSLLVLVLTAQTLPAANEPVPLKFELSETSAGRINSDGTVEVKGDTGLTTTQIMHIEHPPVDSSVYYVRGRVKCQNVTGQAYLEMWSDFGSRGQYFSRTLASYGSMRSISGTADWREFELPFYADSGWRPERLTINVVMPGQGTISIGQVTLAETSPSWWSEPQGGLVGGVGGGVLGTLGAVIGVLASRRKARPVVISLIGVCLALGGLSLLVGIVALCLGQPFHVTYPLLLLGGITVLVLGGNAIALRRRFRDEDLRRMAALDA
jgi:hypothetical protein